MRFAGWVGYATVDWKSVMARHAVRVPIKNLRLLLRDEDRADGNTKERFEKWSRGRRRDVRFEADTLVASEIKEGFVPDYNHLDLYGIWGEAESVAKDRPAEAAKICMGLSESLGIHYNMIDDSSGEQWPLFEKCVGYMGDCIRRQELSAEGRRWYIEYLAGWSLVVFSDFATYYEDVLAKLCTHTGDLNVWKGVLEDELRRDDIDDRVCYWAARRGQIEESLARVQERIGDSAPAERPSL